MDIIQFSALLENIDKCFIKPSWSDWEQIITQINILQNRAVWGAWTPHQTLRSEVGQDLCLRAPRDLASTEVILKRQQFNFFPRWHFKNLRILWYLVYFFVWFEIHKEMISLKRVIAQQRHTNFIRKEMVLVC